MYMAPVSRRAENCCTVLQRVATHLQLLHLLCIAREARVELAEAIKAERACGVRRLQLIAITGAHLAQHIKQWQQAGTVCANLVERLIQGADDLLSHAQELWAGDCTKKRCGGARVAGLLRVTVNVDEWLENLVSAELRQALRGCFLQILHTKHASCKNSL
jgi:hypothetical protein